MAFSADLTFITPHTYHTSHTPVSLPIPDSRFPISDSRFPFPSWEGLGVGSDSRFPTTKH